MQISFVLVTVRHMARYSVLLWWLQLPEEADKRVDLTICILLFCCFRFLVRVFVDSCLCLDSYLSRDR